MAKLALDSGRHAYSERADDLYETPPAAVLALLGAESLPRRIWERAAGRGAIVEVVRSAGHDVVASDLRDHGDHRCPGTTTGIESFNTLVAPDGDLHLNQPAISQKWAAAIRQPRPEAVPMRHYPCAADIHREQAPNP